ncbi:hypothetical protein F0327_25280 [Citrobacter braakii]|nr:hypothetical protein F0327_25280 [Citrobacter braakii]
MMLIIFILFAIWLCRSQNARYWPRVSTALLLLMLVAEQPARSKGLRKQQEPYACHDGVLSRQLASLCSDGLRVLY